MVLLILISQMVFAESTEPYCSLYINVLLHGSMHSSQSKMVLSNNLYKHMVLCILISEMVFAKSTEPYCSLYNILIHGSMHNAHSKMVLSSFVQFRS
jgi:hypothetical protein